MTSARILRVALGAAAMLGVASFSFSASADTGDREPIYDFKNQYYSVNGVRPGRLQGRRNGQDGLSVVDRPLHPNQRPVRVTLTAPAYDDSGDLIFFAPVAFTYSRVPLKSAWFDIAKRKERSERSRRISPLGTMKALRTIVTPREFSIGSPSPFPYMRM